MSPRSAERLLPHSDEAEVAVLGALLLDNSLLDGIDLGAEDFYRSGHAAVLRAIRFLRASSTVADLVTVGEAMGLREVPSRLRSPDGVREGLPYLASLTDGVPRSASIASYVAIVAQKARRRRFLTAVGNAFTKGHDEIADADLLEYWKDAAEMLNPEPSVPRAVDILGPDVTAEPPEFDVDDFLPRRGVVKCWSQPAGKKTYTWLRITGEMLTPRADSRLLGHPALKVRRRWKKVVWISAEETTGRLRSKLDWVLRGLDRQIDGVFLHIWAMDPRRPVSLADLPTIVAAERPDAVICDHYSGLFPTSGEWADVDMDRDNSGTQKLWSLMRGVTASNDCTIIVLHHCGRDVTRYRGPSAMWASCDTLISLQPDYSGAGVKVLIEKQRDGRVLPPFLLLPGWESDRFTLGYGGAATAVAMSPAEQRADVFLQGIGRASQAKIMKAAKIKSRSTINKAVEKLLAAGRWRDTGEKEGNSPIYEFVKSSTGEERPFGSSEAEAGGSEGSAETVPEGGTAETAPSGTAETAPGASGGSPEETPEASP